MARGRGSAGNGHFIPEREEMLGKGGQEGTRFGVTLGTEGEGSCTPPQTLHPCSTAELGAECWSSTASHGMWPWVTEQS